MNLLGLTLFQQIALPLLGLLFLGSVAALVRGWATRREGLILAAVWLAAGVAILRPEITSRVAKALGIGRGADLVFYCAVLAMMVGVWMVYIRLRRVRREITLLVRHLAVREAQEDAAGGNRYSIMRSPPAPTPESKPDAGNDSRDDTGPGPAGGTAP
jgi:hypothetical protein